MGREEETRVNVASVSEDSGRNHRFERRFGEVNRGGGGVTRARAHLGPKLYTPSGIPTAGE